MFDRISPRYDLLNHVLSLGLDYGWRRKAGRLLESDDKIVLDLACGTGDLALVAAESARKGRLVVGADKAGAMLHLAARKIAHRHLTGSIGLIRADGMATPFKDCSFDAAMMAFGIRNMADVRSCLQELHRVLKVDGEVIILEFSLPTNGVIRAVHLFYLRRIVPFLGKLLSGDADAYRYLGQTIESFPRGEGFCRILRDAGFVDVTAKSLSFGVVTLYRGKKS